MEAATQTPVKFTPAAIAEVKRLMNADDFEAEKKLRVGVKGGGCSGMTYILNFDNPMPSDEIYLIDGVEIIMEKSHEIYLANMEVNWEGGLNSRGFTFTNPNASSTCGCGTSFAV